MSARARVRSYGVAALLVLAGIICAVFTDGIGGEVVAITLITLGLGAAVLLVFFEVGLSEDHARAEEDAQRRRIRRRS
ncbi:MAG: hypothetical protein ACJ76V_15170 [Thermoleophilaceae bacterium]